MASGQQNQEGLENLESDSNNNNSSSSNTSSGSNTTSNYNSGSTSSGSPLEPPVARPTRVFKTQSAAPAVAPAVAEVSQVREKKTKKPRKPQELEEMPTTLEGWSKLRSLEKKKAPFKNTTGYTFTDDGNLQVDGGNPIEVVPKVRALPETLQKYFSERAEKLKEPEAEFAKVKRKLNEVMINFRAGTATKDDVVQANQDVEDAERKINYQTKFPRKIVHLGDLNERELYPEKYYDVRKIAENITGVVYNTFPYEAFWENKAEVVAVEEAPRPEELFPQEQSLAEAEAAAEEKRRKRAAFFAGRARSAKANR